MRCRFCQADAVAVVRHRGPEGRWYLRADKDPTCGDHLIRLRNYWGAEVFEVPPETAREACLRALREIQPASAAQVAEVLGRDRAAVWNALYRLWIDGTARRHKIQGRPWIYSLENANDSQ
mgnify:CR=1 FL=1